jgi:peptidoglycan/xylan/chitin deacetylase (PgdA/CDA1 family)
MKKGIVAVIVLLIAGGAVFLAPSAKAASLEKGCVTFTVDDNETSVYSLMYPALKKYSFPATSYVVTDWMGTPDHMSWKQLKTLQNTGKWEIGNHTQSHLNLTTLSASDMKAQITNAQSAFSKNGIKTPKAFAAPYGEFGSQTVSALKSLGFTSNRWAWSEFGKFNEVDSFDPFNITVVSFKSPMKYADAKKLIDEAATGKKWLVFVVHGVVKGNAGDYEVSSTDLKQTAQYLNSLKKKGSVNVKTVSQCVDLMRGKASGNNAQSSINIQSSASSSASASASSSSSVTISQ